MERLNFKRALLLESGRALELARETKHRRRQPRSCSNELTQGEARAPSGARFLHFLTVYYVFRFFCQISKKASFFTKAENTTILKPRVAQESRFDALRPSILASCTKQRRLGLKSKFEYRFFAVVVTGVVNRPDHSRRAITAH